MNNDFHESFKIFEIFEGLEVKGLTKPAEPFAVTAQSNGVHPPEEVLPLN